LQQIEKRDIGFQVGSDEKTGVRRTIQLEKTRQDCTRKKKEEDRIESRKVSEREENALRELERQWLCKRRTADGSHKSQNNISVRPGKEKKTGTQSDHNIEFERSGCRNMVPGKKNLVLYCIPTVRALGHE